MRTLMVLTAAIAVCMAVAAENAGTNSYTQTNLVSDIPGTAISTDPSLINPWGLSHYTNPSAAEGQWWASDQVTGVSTLYSADGTIAPLTITIPPASGTGPGSPTGTVGFGKNFVFVTLDGTISQWLSGAAPASATGRTLTARGAMNHHAVPAQPCVNCHVTSASIQVNHASRGTVYTGATAATVNNQSQLYVAGSAGVEVYNSSFQPLSLGPSAFTDPNVPAGFTPYGIQAVGSKIYVTFSPPPPATGGYVDVFDTSGNLLLTLQPGAWLDEPWGVAAAPANFGGFSSTVLVGNTGSGRIAAFNPKSGKFLGFLKNASGAAIANPGLWALYFGDGNPDSGPTNTLYFNAGIQNFTHGLFGSIVAN